MLLPFLSSRMVRLTIEYGYCEDSLIGLATAGFALFLFTDNIQLATHIGKVSELLVEESPNRNTLRSRLANELIGTLQILQSPFHSVGLRYPELYQSAMLAGDVCSALICRWVSATIYSYLEFANHSFLLFVFFSFNFIGFMFM